MPSWDRGENLRQPPVSVPPQDPIEAAWFERELKPHEPMLRAWLKAQFGLPDDVDDVIQEAYIRVLRAHAQGEVKAPKAFLFATARNIVLMQLRHREVTRIETLTEDAFAGILDDSADVAAEVSRSQELELLTQAIQALPTRCRQILTLRKIYGLSQREVAQEMGISEHTVEAQGTIALRKLGEFFARHGAGYER